MVEEFIAETMYNLSLILVDPREGTGTCATLGTQILSISCSFWENLAKLYVGAPGELAPPLGNPGSATD